MSVNLLEYVRQTGPFRVDRENAVIHGVKVIGLESENNRSYLKEAVGKAIKDGMYERRVTNVDHGTKAGESTTVAWRNGWLENVAQDDTGGGTGEWHLIKSHPLTPMILEIAERAPWLLGLSHNASGKTRRDSSGREIVEAIEKVHSVDVVADPATTKGLHEERKMKLTIKALAESLKATRPGYSRGLLEVADSGVMSPDMPMDAPEEAAAPPEEKADHEQALKDGFRGAMIAVLDDDSMDMKAMLSKLKEIMAAKEKLLGGKGKAADEPDGDEPAAAEESRKLKLEIAGLKLLNESGVKADRVLTKALSACTSESEVKELIESAKSSGRTAPGTGAKSSPRTQTPLKEEKETIPAGGAELAAWLRN